MYFNLQVIFGVFFAAIFVVIFLVVIISTTKTTISVKNIDFYSAVQTKKPYPVVKNITNNPNLYLVVREGQLTSYILSSSQIPQTFDTTITIGDQTFNKTFHTNNDMIHKELLDIPFELTENSLCFPDTNIPKKIMQTYINNFVGKGCYLNMTRTALMNDDCEYFYFENMRSYLYIADNFPPKIIKAYNTIIPGAFKADIFRLCWLYIEGGIYMDMTIEPIYSMYEIIQQLDLQDKRKEVLFVKDRKIPSNTHKAIYNALIMATPKSDIVYKLLMNICDNVLQLAKNEDFSQNPLNYTGPNIIGDILYELTDSYAIPWKLNSGTIMFETTPMFSTKYKGYSSERINVHYGVICKNKQQFSHKFSNKFSDKNIDTFHCLGENFGTKLLCKNIENWNSFNYDYIDQKEFIKNNFPDKIHNYMTILDESIRDKYFCLLRLYKNKGVAINPFLEKNIQFQENLLKYEDDFIYCDKFIYARTSNLPIIQQFISFIEENCLDSVYSIWEDYIISQSNIIKFGINNVLSQYLDLYRHANQDIFYLGKSDYSRHLQINNKHSIRVLVHNIIK